MHARSTLLELCAPLNAMAIACASAEQVQSARFAVNDADFSVEGREASKLALHYRQAKPGRRKCCGVRIELFSGVA